MNKGFNKVMEDFEYSINAINTLTEDEFNKIIAENNLDFFVNPRTQQKFRDFFSSSTDQKKLNIAKALIQQYKEDGLGNAEARAAEVIGWRPRDLSSYLRQDDNEAQARANAAFLSSPVTAEKIDKYYTDAQHNHDPSLLKRMQYAIDLIKHEVDLGSDIGNATRKIAAHAKLNLRGLWNYVSNETTVDEGTTMNEARNKGKLDPKELNAMMKQPFEVVKRRAAELINMIFNKGGKDEIKRERHLRNLDKHRNTGEIVYQLYNIEMNAEGHGVVTSRWNESSDEGSLSFTEQEVRTSEEQQLAALQVKMESDEKIQPFDDESFYRIQDYVMAIANKDRLFSGNGTQELRIDDAYYDLIIQALLRKMPKS